MKLCDDILDLKQSLSFTNTEWTLSCNLVNELEKKMKLLRAQSEQLELKIKLLDKNLQK